MENTIQSSFAVKKKATSDIAKMDDKKPGEILTLFGGWADSSKSPLAVRLQVTLSLPLSWLRKKLR